MKARWLAFFLVLVIAPGTMEVVERAVHFAKYGDIADADGDKHDAAPLGADEHGCNGTFHFCSCHGNPGVRATERIATVLPFVPLAIPSGPPSVVSLDGLRAPLPDLRPPIA